MSTCEPDRLTNLPVLVLPGVVAERESTPEKADANAERLVTA